MRQVARGDRGRHDAPHMSGEEGEGFSGTTVQTPTTGSGEDWREEAQWGRNEERVGERRSGKKGREDDRGVSEERNEETRGEEARGRRRGQKGRRGREQSRSRMEGGREMR